MSKIKSKDEVIVLTGKSKGRRGVVLKVIDAGKRAVVEGVNLIKKHVKANPQAEKAGGIIEKEAPIDISNLAIFNVDTGKQDRVGYKFLEDGKKVRIYKSTGEVIDK
jgi:large subunit ribosomal protein L24